MKKSDPKFVRAFDRGMLRSQFVGLFWAIISARKKRDGFKLQDLATALGKNKGEVSRWFSGDPNWTVNTISNLAHVFDVEIRVEAVERSTGVVYTASGAVAQPVQTQTIVGETNSVTSGNTTKPLIFGHFARADSDWANAA